MTRYRLESIRLAVGLAALAGYVDAVGFLSINHLFVSFMSGNTTRLGVHLADGNLQPALIFAGGIALFVTGVVAGSLVARRAGSARKIRTLWLVAMLLALAATSATFGWRRPMIATLLLAMGAENVVFQRRGEVTMGLTYITGTLVRMGQHLASAFHGGPRWAWVPFAVLWLGFLSGAALGSGAERWMHQLALWPAVLAAVGLTIAARHTRPQFR
jgi:uncharacterized membrane protein YoaK (UPF0700 family)